ATGIKVVDTMPAGTRFRSASGDSGFTCSQDGSATGGVVTCVGGHLIGTESEFYSPAGSSSLLPGDQFPTIKIRFFAPSTAQTMHNEVRVNPDNTIPEIDQLNNIATDNSVVTSCLNQSDCTNTGAFNELTIDKTQVSPANPVARNGIVTYNLKVSNLG